MSDDDLLDDILGETAIKDAAEAAKADAAARAERAIARAARESEAARAPEDPADRARRLDTAPESDGEDDDGIERTRRAYTADPRHNILGLTVGRRFAFHDSGDDLDGEWVVAKIEDDGSRLYASRDGKTAPFIQIDEDVVREEIGNKRLRPL